jgi:hypothetical protein
MNKEFLPYEQASALKELGFGEPCLAMFDEYKIFEYNSILHNANILIDCVSAPLYQQAFRWLRETHNIDVDVVRDSEVHYQDETRWIVKTSNWNDIRVKDFPIAQLKFPNTSHHTDFKTYNEALEKGLEEALKFIKK